MINKSNFGSVIIDNHDALGLYSYFIITFILAYLFHFMFLKKKYHLPPGPLAWPILGNNINQQTSFKLWSGKFRRIYGDVILIFVGRQPTVIINNYDIAVEAIGDNYPKNLSDKPEPMAIGKDNASARHSPEWKHLEQTVMQKCMRGRNMEIANSRSFDRFSKDVPINESIELSDHLHQLSFNTMSGLLFDRIYESNDEEFKWITNTMMKITQSASKVSYVDMLPIVRQLQLPMLKTNQQPTEEYLNFLEKKINEHKAMLTEDARDVTDWLLYECTQDEELNFMRKGRYMRDIISDILFGGSDTTKHTLHWMIGILACKIEIQARIRIEIENHKKTLPAGERSPSLKWRGCLPYTCAAINEVIRYASVSPAGLRYSVVNDCKIGKFDIPKGFEVLVNSYGFHYDSQYWQESESFQPERFLNADGECLSKHRGFTPFSFARRVCIGEALAMGNIFLLIVSLCSSYEFVWDAENEDECIREADNNVHYRLPNAFKITIKKR